jgi:hypothetical protein
MVSECQLKISIASGFNVQGFRVERSRVEGLWILVRNPLYPMGYVYNNELKFKMN